MSDVIGKLTIYFENPFWVGILERIEDGMLSVAKITFGAEPKDYEVYAFLLKHYNSFCFSPAVEADAVKEVKNPKKMQREARKQLQDTGIGTKSQQALQLQREQNKLERKAKSREQKQIEAQRRFQLHRQQKKEKHKGH